MSECRHGLEHGTCSICNPRAATTVTRARAWDPGITSIDACRLTGLTYRQLDYWARTGLITPSAATAQGSGTARRWTEDDVRLLKIAAQLLSLGISLQRVRDAFASIRDSDDTRWLVIPADGPPSLIPDAGLDATLDSLAVGVIVNLHNTGIADG